MAEIFRAVLVLHVTSGFVGFVAFWTPAIARKGGAVHTRAGKVFFWATRAVAVSGLAMATLLLVDPLAVRPLRRALPPEAAAAVANRIRLMTVFLYYLLFITFVPVYHGVRVLATRRQPSTLRTRFHTAVNVATIAAAVGTAAVGVVTRQPVFVFMSPIGLLIGVGNLQFARRRYPTPMAWWYEHMNSMLGGGIAFHTAFLVLGAGRLFGIQLDGPAAVAPWLLPTAIGIPASAMWTRYYRRKFREDRVADPSSRPATPVPF